MANPLIVDADHGESFLKIGLAGPSGSGKTWSSILMAKGLIGDLSKVIVIDTEDKSCRYYRHLGKFKRFDFREPFNPQRYVTAIDICIKEGFEMIIIDSISHEWEGTGGCLEIHSKLGGKWQDWDIVNPMHRVFLNSILRSPAHFIVTMRKKQDNALVEKNGKKVVEKFGLKNIQREGFEYELTLSLDINMDHNAMISKNRTTLFQDGIPFKITEDTGKEIAKWNKGDII